MPRARRGTRRTSQQNPVGRIDIAQGGYGFVDTPEGEYFVPASKMGGAFQGDVVEVKPIRVNHDRPQVGKLHNVVGKRPSARVVGVVERAHASLVGRYEIAEPFGVVIPEDSRIQHDIFTMHRDNPGVSDGNLVRVRITEYPDRHRAAMGVVEEVLGRAQDKGVLVDAIIASHNLRVEFPEEALAEAQEMRVDADLALDSGYRDLRERCIFTIDPPDARDFDDGLSLDRLEDGSWRLGVHIADVSYYVAPGSAVDAEARMRATSVYLVDRVLPMLPEALSNGVCSLAPGQDRRCFTVDVLLSEAGQPRSVEFYPALMRSHARLDYEQVQAFLESDASQALAKCAQEPAGSRDSGQDVRADAPLLETPLAWRIAHLARISEVLGSERQRAGALDLETSEAHVLLDDDGKPVEVGLRKSTRATRLVEQCMILANTLVAQALEQAGSPALYRVHDAPDPAALGMLVPLLQEFGYTREVDAEAFAAGNTRALQRVLELSRAGQEAELVSLLLLRSLKRASYQAYCSPHFGLALDEYTHFTSPIRRYPDLVVHRALKCLLAQRGALDKSLACAMPKKAQLALIAEHSSAMERSADEAALQSQTLKLVEYLGNRMGEVFSGVISRVASYGFFVQLDNTAVGLVALGDAGEEPFSLDVRRQLLTGQDSGRVYRVGQRVLVRVVAARPKERELDFVLS